MVFHKSNDLESKFKFSFTITFSQIDWAGRIFYSRIFEIAQASLEQFLATTELGSLADTLKTKAPLPVVIHAESNYQIPITLGDQLEIGVSCLKIGKTSFTMDYHVWKTKTKKEGKMSLAAHVRVVHVMMKGDQKVSLSHKWKNALSSIYRQNSDC